MDSARERSTVPDITPKKASTLPAVPLAGTSTLLTKSRWIYCWPMVMADMAAIIRTMANSGRI